VPVTRELRFTAHGPVLWSDARRALVLKWVGAEPGTAGYLGSLALDRARNWTQFLDAMQRWKVPAENIVYADIYGNIGEESAGLAPLRKSWTGLLPVEGTSGKYEWSGFIPLDQLPRWYNPPEGFVATANDNVIAPNYPYHIGYEWSAPYRVHRIEELLRAGNRNGQKLDLDAMTRIQTDVTSLAAQTLLTLLRRAAPNSDDPTLKMMLAWNGELARDSSAAALYEVWANELKRALTLRLLQSPGKPADNKLARLVEGRLSMPVVFNLLRTPTKEAFGENAVNERNNLMVTTFQSATRELARLQGNDPKNWSWGKLHEVRFRHPLDQVTPGAAEVFDLGPLKRPGDGMTVNATSGMAYAQTHGASYREILDTSKWDNSRAVNTPGQSGQPASPHYSDLMQMWDRGEYFPLLFSREAVENGAVDKLVLQPAATQ
jgi:penicillin amidase